MITADIQDLRDLLRRYADHPVLTLTLPTDPADPANHRESGSRSWEVQLRTDLQRLDHQQAAQADRHARFRTAREAAEGWLASHQPTARTVILVVAGDEVIDVELPVVLPQSATFGRPAVLDLVRSLAEHRRYAIVLVDGETARVAEAAMGFIDDRALLRLDSRWGEPWPTRSEHKFRFDARRLEYQAKHQRAVAGGIDDLIGSHPQIERLVLGGNATEAHGVARELGQPASQRLVGIVPAPVALAEADLLERIAPVVDAVEQDADRAVMDALRAATGSGRAVFGGTAVQDALASGAVREVVLSSHLDDRGAAEEIVAQALLAGADVSVVHHDAATALDAYQGVGALLHYAAVVVP